MIRLGFYIIHNNRYKMVKIADVPWDISTGQPDSNYPIIDKPIIGEWDPMKYVLRQENIAYEDEFQIVVKQKIKLDPSEQKDIIKLYRVTYNHQGIFDAVRKYMTAEEWQEFLNDENVNWLYKPDIYEKTYISYFTENGYKQFKEKTLPLILNIFQEENIKTRVFEVVRENTDIEDSEENEEAPDDNEEEKIIFEDWITDYCYNTLFQEKDFFDIFNTDRTYIILSEQDISIMGFLVIQKGRTYLNFKEHDYRNIVNALYPTIRKDMIIPDESFGGYEEDKDFSQDVVKPDDSFGGYEEDKDFLVDSENKGINTYPNLF